MTHPCKFAAVLLATLAGAAAIAFSVRAQPQPQTPIPMPAQPPSAPASAMNHNLVVLDPAHGGPDSGAQLPDHTLEKNVTLALAVKLRATLSAAGFTVLSTRDADPPAALTPDQRAEFANRAHAVACIVLHATATGSGVHLYTSTLQPPSEEPSGDLPSSFVPVPWDTAQAGSISQSLRLADDLSSALAKDNLPLLVGRAPVRPLDNLICPAVAIEIAPLPVPGEDATPVTDPAYQQRVAAALTAALQTWRSHADPLALSMPADAEDLPRTRQMASVQSAGRSPNAHPQPAPKAAP